MAARVGLRADFGEVPKLAKLSGIPIDASGKENSGKDSISLSIRIKRSWKREARIIKENKLYKQQRITLINPDRRRTSTAAGNQVEEAAGPPPSRGPAGEVYIIIYILLYIIYTLYTSLYIGSQKNNWHVPAFLHLVRLRILRQR